MPTLQKKYALTFDQTILFVKNWIFFLSKNYFKILFFGSSSILDVPEKKIYIFLPAFGRLPRFQIVFIVNEKLVFVCMYTMCFFFRKNISKIVRNDCASCCLVILVLLYVFFCGGV
jgi:hypothetical protein